MVLNFILASICIEKNWGDEKILVIPVTWQISAQPLVTSQPDQEVRGQQGARGSVHYAKERQQQHSGVERITRFATQRGY